MLILARRVGEVLNLYQGDKLLGRIAIADIRGNRVQVGLEFPPDVQIARDEVDKRLRFSISTEFSAEA